MGVLINECEHFQEGPPCVPGSAPSTIVDFIQKNLIGQTVLDFGGGQGAYALELSRRGFKVTVADINSNSLEVAKSNGLEIIDLSRENAIADGVVDNVIMIEVLEHLEDPVSFLKDALRFCKKRVVFTTPCGESFDDLNRLGLTYSHIPVTDHRWCFTDKHIEGILSSLGCDYKLEKGDFLFPAMAIDSLRNAVSGSLIGKLALVPVRFLWKMGWLKEAYPSRYYGVITKN